jgi:hypothetical protein
MCGSVSTEGVISKEVLLHKGVLFQDPRFGVPALFFTVSYHAKLLLKTRRAMPGRSCWLYLPYPYPSKGRKVNIVIDGLFMMSATMHLRRQAHRALTTSCFRGSSEVILASRPLVTPTSSRASSRFAATRRSLSAVPSSDDRPLIPGIGRGKTSTGLVCFFNFFRLVSAPPPPTILPFPSTVCGHCDSRLCLGCDHFHAPPLPRSHPHPINPSPPSFDNIF